MTLSCSSNESNEAAALPPATGGGTGTGGSPGTGGTGMASGGTDSTVSSGGSSATGGAPASIGGTGGAIPRDPKAFDWPETTPPVGTCEPGSYSGTFTCDVSFIPGTPTGRVEGPISFVLKPSADGEFLVIEKGRMDAVAVGFVPFGADLDGKLDCATSVFSADAINGVYGPVPPGIFFGVLDGKLDRLASTLTGTWTLTGGTKEAPQLISCSGAWSAVKK